MQHPSSGISKEYVVATSGQLTPRQIKAVAEGCEMDGVLVQPLSVEQVPGLRDRLRIVVGEGRNREVLPQPGGSCQATCGYRLHVMIAALVLPYQGRLAMTACGC